VKSPPPTEIMPELLIPSENVAAFSTTIPPGAYNPTTAIVPLLLIPPPNVETPSTTMPLLNAAISPLLVIPPRKVVTQLQTRMPKPEAATIVPLLAMPPENVSTDSTTIPAVPPEFALIVPLLLIPPPKVDTPFTTMPACVATMRPWLVMLPPNVDTALPPPTVEPMPTAMPTCPVMTPLAALVIVSAKLPAACTQMPAEAAAIVPLLVMPPVNVDTGDA
jgi:hypothetical protein